MISYKLNSTANYKSCRSVRDFNKYSNNFKSTVLLLEYSTLTAVQYNYCSTVQLIQYRTITAVQNNYYRTVSTITAVQYNYYSTVQ